MPLDPMIAHPFVPDFSNTLGDIARLRVADNYRNALLQQDQQRFDYKVQQDQAAQDSADDEDAAWEQAYQAKDWGAMARIDPQTTKILYDYEQAQKPAAPIQTQTFPGVGTGLVQDGKLIPGAFRETPQAQTYAPETFQPFTQADGTVVLLGSRGTQRPTGLKGKVAADPVDTQKADKAASNQQAWDTYQTAMSGLSEAMAATETGPVTGRLPAFTAAQQTADGAVAAMAPVLKQLFRTAGEGTFTDKDQQLLLAMVPTRTDRPEARANKIANINRIVQAKLGVAAPAAPASQSKSYTTKGGAKVEILE